MLRSLTAELGGRPGAATICMVSERMSGLDMECALTKIKTSSHSLKSVHLKLVLKAFIEISQDSKSCSYLYPEMVQRTFRLVCGVHSSVLEVSGE